MKKFYINIFDQYTPNKWRIGLGIITVVIAISFAIVIKPLEWWHLIYSIYFTLLGLFVLLMGLGFNPVELFGQAYIQIDEEGIDYKPQVLTKAIALNWNEINRVDIMMASIKVLLKNQKIIILEYDHLEYHQIQQLKNNIVSTCSDLNIPLIQH